VDCLTVKYPGSAPKALGLPASASTSGKSSLDAEAQVMWRATGNLKHEEEEEKRRRNTSLKHAISVLHAGSNIQEHIFLHNSNLIRPLPGKEC